MIAQKTGLDVSPLDLATSYYFADVEQIEKTNDPIIRAYLQMHPDYKKRILADRVDTELDAKPLSRGSHSIHPFISNLEGGTESSTVLLASARGLCSDTTLPSNDGLANYKSQLEDFENEANHGGGAISPEIAKLIPQFRDPVADLFNSKWLDLNHRRCGQRTKLALVPVEEKIAADIGDFYDRRGANTHEMQNRLLEVLDFALDNGRIASIGYDLNSLLSPSYRDDENIDHASTIVGRRFLNGRCEYLLRDPSGSDCSVYKENLRNKCSDHHIWIGETELFASIYGIVYLR